MATQTIEFRAAPGLTLTVELFGIGSDTIVATASATEQTNRNGTYRVAFTSVAAGEYQLIAFSGATPVASWLVTLALVTGTYQTYTRSTAVNFIAPDNATIGNIYTVLQFTDADVATLLTRIAGTIRTATDDATAETAQTAAVRDGLALESTLTQIKGSTFAEATDALDAIRAAVDAGGGGGGPGLTGPWARTITVTDSVSGDPIQNATVRFFRTGETESRPTNASGVATFTVEAATWSYAIVANGYAGASGTVVVSASGDTPVALVASSPAPPANPNNATLRVTCIGEDSQIAPGAVVSIRMVEAPAGQVGFGYDGTIATFTADSNGIAERQVARGATYEIRREGTYKQWQKYVMPTDEDLILIESFVQP